MLRTPRTKRFTGFTCLGQDLYTDDVLSIYNGYMGFVQIVERADGFWMVNWADGRTADENSQGTKLKRNLTMPYMIIDPTLPYNDPPLDIYCDHCKEALIGEIYIGKTVRIVWNDNCGSYSVRDAERTGPYACGLCTECCADSELSNPKKQP